MAEQQTYPKNTRLMAIPLPAAITVSGANSDDVSCFTPVGGRIRAVGWHVSTGVTTTKAVMTLKVDGTTATTFDVAVAAAGVVAVSEFANTTEYDVPAGASKITLTSDGGPAAGAVEFIVYVEA